MNMIALGLMLVWAACPFQDKEWPAGGEKDGLELSIKSGKTEYSGKEEMELQIRLLNKSDAPKKFTFHHDMVHSVVVLQGNSRLTVQGGGCACGTYEAGAVEVTLKPGESKTCEVKVALLANKGHHQIEVVGTNIWPNKGPTSNTLGITIQ
jgi:hypothetical protein